MSPTQDDQDDQDDEDSEISLPVTMVKRLTPPQPSGYGEFEINVEAVLRAGLPPYFSSITPAPLTLTNVLKLPVGAKGGYILTLDGQDVYAGKTDTRHGFRSRLARHFKTVQHRHNLSADTVSFKAVRIPVFSSFDAEAILIRETRRVNPAALPWNDTGFGSNDPGHRREGQEPAMFDKQHPIDIDRQLPFNFLRHGHINLRDALLRMKMNLPYTLRYESDLNRKGKPDFRAGHPDQRAAVIVVPPEPMTTRRFMQMALDVLPSGWMATIFPDRVILYKEPMVWRFGLERITKGT